MKNDEIEDIFSEQIEEELEEIEQLISEEESIENQNSQVQNSNYNPILNSKINSLTKNQIQDLNLNKKNIPNNLNNFGNTPNNLGGIMQKANTEITNNAQSAGMTQKVGQGMASAKAATEAVADETLKKELTSLVAKKLLTSKVALIAGIAVLIIVLILIIVVLISTLETDESEINTSNEIIGVVNGTMTIEEITDYLVYMGICRNLETRDATVSACANTGFSKFLVEFNTVYNKYNQEPYLDKYGNPVELDIALIMETISYNRTNNELIELLDTHSGYSKIINELDELAEAQVEYVQEVGDYYNSNCVLTKDKNIGTPYYMISDDKYISYLKYGKVHENYSGEIRIFDSIIHPDSELTCIPEGLEYTPPDTLRYVGEEVVDETSGGIANNPGMSTLLKDEDSGMEYYIYRPDGSNTIGKPIIFAFHGTNPSSKEIGTGEFAAYQLVKDKKVTPDAIIVYPTKNYSSSWVKNSSTSSEAIKIAKFIKNIVEKEDADLSRVYYYGFSMGVYDAVEIITATGIGYFRAAALNDGNPGNISNNNYLGLKGIYIIEAAENRFSGTTDNKANGVFNNFSGKFKLEDHSGKSHAWANGFGVADHAGDAQGIWNCNETGNAFGWLLSV